MFQIGNQIFFVRITNALRMTAEVTGPRTLE